MSGDDVVKRLWVRGWCEVIDWEEEASMLSLPHLPTLLWASPGLNFLHQWDRPKLGIRQGDWGRVSGALLGLPDSGLNFNPLGPV